MELLYLNYKNSTKYILLLYLGERHGKHCGLTNESISSSEAKLIKENYDLLAAMSIEERIGWCKQNCALFKQGYREIYTTNTAIINKYELK